MAVIDLFKGIAVTIALLGAGSLLAEDLPLVTDSAQQREKMRSMGSEDRAAYRDQMQERVRNMTPEEQKLMRETRSEGRDRMENQQGDGSRQSNRGGGKQGGSGYGQGYESRQGGGMGDGGGGGGGGGGRRGR